MSSSGSSSIPSLFYRCGLRSRIRHSSKERSLGRAFYGCPNYKSNVEPGCGFFVWVEDLQRVTADEKPKRQYTEGMTTDIEMKMANLQKSLDEIVSKIDKQEEKIDNMYYLLQIVVTIFVLCCISKWLQ